MVIWLLQRLGIIGNVVVFSINILKAMMIVHIPKTFEMLKQNRTKIWNKVELIELYEQNGGTTLSRKTLLGKVEGQFGDDIMSFHSKGVATLVVFNDNVARTLNIVHTKDDDEVTLKKLGKETSQESRTVKEELKSYQDYLVTTADMQIDKIIVNIIF